MYILIIDRYDKNVFKSLNDIKKYLNYFIFIKNDKIHKCAIIIKNLFFSLYTDIVLHSKTV